MSESITAIYERGVLRPLKPLNLPEQTQVEIQIVASTSASEEEKQQARQALLEAGVIRRQPTVTPIEPVSETDLAAAARTLGATGSLSELILAEREGR